MRLFRSLPALALVALSACGPAPSQPPVEGQDDFSSAGVGGRSGDTREASPGSAAGDSAGGGQPRSVEEGDVFKLANDVLYVLNAYRGLQIVDVHQPDQPTLQGTSPILGQPVEMYLRDGYAYVIVSDYFTYWQQADGAAQPFHGSQVRVVDVRVPSQPVVVGGIDIDGAVSDTRIVGDVLYVVSNRWAWYSNPTSTDSTDELFVASIDLANPAAPRLVERQSFPGSSNQIHVSPTTLYVASPAEGSDWQHPRTDVTVVDIDDPHGHLVTKGSLSVDGAVSDRFQLDEYQGTFRVVSHSGSWGQDGSQKLSVFTVGQQQALLSQLDLPNTGGLFATRFAGDRAYLVTMVSIDPLEVIDLRDAAHPVLTHSLVIPGVLHHIEPRGDRLLALGTDDRWSGVAASLFDVADPRQPALLSRVQVGAAGGGYSWSNANWDDKALRVLDQDGMMLVPFSAWEQQNGNSYGKYVNGFQIIDFDRTHLTARGVVEQDGQVARLTENRQRLLSISDRVLQSIDATDRDRPRVTGRVELARDVNDFLVVGGKALSLTTTGWWWDAQTVDLRVSTLADPEAGSLAKVAVPFRAYRLVADGSDAIVLGYPADWDGTLRAARVSLADPAHPQLGQPVALGAAQQGGDSYEWLYLEAAVSVGAGRLAVPAWGSRRLADGTWTSTSALVVADLAAGTTSRVELEGAMSGELFVVGGQLWTGHQESIAAANGRAMSRFYVDRIDLSGPQPQLLPKVNVPGSLVGAADGGQLLFTRDYQWDANGNVTHALAELRLQGNRAHLRQYLTLDEGLGRIVVQGRRLYATTQRWWWMRASGSASDGVTLRTYLSTDAQPLHEVSRLPVAGWMQLREAAGGYLFLGSGYYGGPWEYGAVDDARMGGDAMPGGMYYAATNGLLVYSLSSPDQPTWRQFVRTNGWVQGLGVDGGTLFVSGGIYGVQKVALTP